VAANSSDQNSPRSGISRRSILGAGASATAAAVFPPLGVSTAFAATSTSAPWTMDLLGPSSELPHFWEECIGGDHAKQALRRDYQDQLVQAHRDLGVKRVRMHGIFDPQMSLYVARRVPTFSPNPYSMFNIDQIYDFFVGSGIQPYVEIGFMPPDLSSSPTGNWGFYYGYNAYPPADWKAWSDLVTAFTRHLVERYGIHEVQQWPFEVWNEPNLSFFWAGTPDQYNTLYETTVKAIKSVDASLQVGGPATDGDGLPYLQNWLDHVQSNNLPLDFVSSHAYENNMLSGANSVADIFAPTKAILPKGMKYHISETGCNYSGDTVQHDTSYAAGFLVKAIDRCDGITDVLSLWCFSDIFEESSQASNIFYGGYGALTMYGVPKPMYRAFELLHKAGTKRLAVTGTDKSTTTGALAVKSDGGRADVFLYNHAYPGGPTPVSETITLTIKNVDSRASATITRMDDDNANPRKAWIDQGSPLYPSQHQLAALRSASELHTQRLAQTASAPARTGGRHDLTFKVTLPPEGVAALHIA
jgi:xylan 1,4-beta-xylosidase